MRVKSRVMEMPVRGKIVCRYCGKEKEGFSFCIGASREPEWTMIEGTGAICCPDCWERARADGQEAVKKHAGG